MKDYTQPLLDQLEEINRVPRQSKNRGPVTEYFKKWAEGHNFTWREDHVQNLVIDVPGTEGYENSPVVVLQGHTDMVCEKTPESTHDFSKDPIEHVIDGDWLRARDTSLGADNGIGLAMAMVAATDEDTAHPPLELLFTTDEEIGLWGADEIKPDFIKGKILINLDSEDMGIFTLGCAGAVISHIDYEMKREPSRSGTAALKLALGGFRGGHSGGDIHKNRGNGTAELVRGLEGLGKEIPFAFASVTGGSAMNAISRSAEALIIVDEERAGEALAYWKQFGETVVEENRTVEEQAGFTAEKAQLPSEHFSRIDSNKLIQSLRLIPHGVVHMNAALPEQVETSVNFGVLLTTEKGIRITTMQRGSVRSRLVEITDRIETFAAVSGGNYSLETFMEPWQPDWNSPLAGRSRALWKSLFHKEAELDVTHGALECGVIGNLCGGMDMISFGPDIVDPHSPDERLRISSLAPVFGFLRELLADLKQEK